MDIIELFRLFGSVLIENKDTLNALKEIDRKGDDTSNNLGKLATVGAAAGAAILAGATVAIVGLANIANGAAETGAKWLELSQRTDIGIESLQKWGFAANMTGVDIEKLKMGMKTLSTAIVDAKDGTGDARDGFETLGISMEQLATMTPEQAFDATMAAMADMPDSAEKNVIGNKLLGKSFVELKPLLDEGSAGMEAFKKRAEELGIVLSDQAVRDAEAYGDKVDEMGIAFDGLKNKIGIAVIPMLQNLIDKFMEFLPIIIEKIIPAVQDFIKEVGDKFNAAKDIFLIAFDEVKKKIEANTPNIQANFEAITKSWNTFFDTVSADNKNFNPSDFGKSFGNLLVLWLQVEGAALSIGLNIAAWIGNIGKFWTSLATGNWQGVIDSFTGVGNSIKGIIEGIIAFFAGAETAKNALNDLGFTFQMWWDGVQIIINGFVWLWQTAGTNIGITLGNIGGFFAMWWAGIQLIIQWFNDQWTAAGVNMQNVGITITNALNGAGDWWITQFNNFITWITELPGKVWQYGVDVVTNLGKGITDTASKALDAVWKLVDDIKKKFLEGFGIHSPSSFIADVVNNLMNTFADNIDGSNIVTFVENLVTQIKDAFSGGNFNIAKALSWLGNGAKDVLSSMGINLPSLMGLLFPTDSQDITSYFGNRESPGGIGSTNHQGIDIGAAYGDIVRAVGDGMVTWVGDAGDGYGNSIWMDLGNGITTLFGHLSKFEDNIYAGDYVKAGTAVGEVGSSGNSTGPHLHYGVYENGVAVDPLTANVGASSSGGDLGSWIMQAINATGAGVENFQHLYQLAMNESSGNPNAINNWDSNAMAGIPSMGLMQTIQSTFDAYSQGGSIWDPVSNAIAAINYMIDRYGSIGNTPLGGYAFGTDYVPQTGPYILHKGEAVTTAKENQTAKQPMVIQLMLQNGAKIAEYIIDDMNNIMGQQEKRIIRGMG